MDISIIIVNYNTKKLTKQCLQSVFEKTHEIVFEVIVVDNASQDGSPQMIRDEFPNAILIESPENLGFGRANNLGVKSATGKYLFFLNSDTLLINNAIKIIFDFMEVNLKAGICGGNLYSERGSMNYSYAIISPFSLIGEINNLLNNLLVKLRYGKNSIFNFSKDPLRIYGCILGADMMIRADIFKDVGGFDEDFFLYHEELELSHRIQKIGWQSYCIPSAKIVHLGGKSSNAEQMLKYSLKNRRLYYLKSYGWLYGKIANSIYIIAIISRLIIFSILRNEKKFKQWKYILSNYNE